jgi:PAS domain S-box-containing protein
MVSINSDLERLRELTKTLVSNGYLSDQTEAWKHAFDSIDDFVCITNRGLNIKFVNKSLLKTLNMDHGYINNNIYKLIPEFVFQFKSGVSHEYNNSIYYGDIYLEDFEGWYESYRHSIVEASGKVIGYLFVLRDITDRKIAENKVILSEHKFREFYSSMLSGAAIHEMIVEDDEFINYRVLDVNPSYERILGIKSEDAVGKLATEIYKCDSAPYIELYRDVVKNDKSIRKEITFMPMERTFLIVAFHLHDNKFATIFEDVTEERNLINKVKYSEALLSSVINNMPDVINIQTPDHEIISLNKAGKKLFNVTSDYVGSKCYELIGRNTQCEECQTMMCKSSKKPEKLEKFLEGVQKWFDCRSYPVLDDSGNILVIVEHLRDITDKKEAEFIKERLHNKVSEYLNRTNFLVAAVDGYIWEKSRDIGSDESDMVYKFIDPTFCNEFYGIEINDYTDFSACSIANNKSSLDLIKEFIKRGDRKHTFLYTCNITDKHVVSIGDSCEYIEMGYIEHKKGDPVWTILKARKTPIFNKFGECTGIIGFATNLSSDPSTIKAMIDRGMVTGEIVKLETKSEESKVYWLKKYSKKNKLTHVDFF